MLKRLQSFVRAVEWYIAPTLCRACGDEIKEREILCMPCYTSLEPVPMIEIAISHTSVLQIHALSRYSTPLRWVLPEYAYYCYDASIALGSLMLKQYKLLDLGADLFVPMPRLWTEKIWNGCIPSEIIAAELSHGVGIPTRRCLRQGVSSVELIDRSCFTDKKIILLDERIGSYTQLIDAAQRFYQAGAREVEAFVACRPEFGR